MHSRDPPVHTPGRQPSFMLSGAWLSLERILLDAFREGDLVSPSGGPLERLNDIYWWPQILPDREHILYVVWDARAGRIERACAGLAMPAPQRI